MCLVSFVGVGYEIDFWEIRFWFLFFFISILFFCFVIEFVIIRDFLC